MKNREIATCYETLSAIANRSEIRERFAIAMKCQIFKPIYDSIEMSRVGLVQKYADDDGKKVDDKNLEDFHSEFKELLDIDIDMKPNILLEDIQNATMQELLILKDVIISGESN